MRGGGSIATGPAEPVESPRSRACSAASAGCVASRPAGLAELPGLQGGGGSGPAHSEARADLAREILWEAWLHEI
jgi:hypothetical protein